MDQPGTYLPYTDTYLPRVNDIEECRSHCTVQGKYNCRSFNYNAFRKECFLSSDDSVSLPEGLHNDRDFIFSERGGCNSGISGPPGIKGELANVRFSHKKTLFFVQAFSMSLLIFTTDCSFYFSREYVQYFVYSSCAAKKPAISGFFASPFMFFLAFTVLVFCSFACSSFFCLFCFMAAQWTMLNELKIHCAG